MHWLKKNSLLFLMLKFNAFCWKLFTLCKLRWKVQTSALSQRTSSVGLCIWKVKEESWTSTVTSGEIYPLWKTITKVMFHPSKSNWKHTWMQPDREDGINNQLWTATKMSDLLECWVNVSLCCKRRNLGHSNCFITHMDRLITLRLRKKTNNKDSMNWC